MIYSKVNNNFHHINEQIKKGGEISPFLLLGENLEILHYEIERYISELFKEYEIDSQSIFRLIDIGESIKIDEVKKFITQGDIKPRFAFQVFLIENFSRMTPQAQNACLKFLEEPGAGNIIFLSNRSEAGILETILSRVQILSFSTDSKYQISGNAFYYSMIESHISKGSDELIRYFFGGKYEKEEYIIFLKTILEYSIKTGKFGEYLDELQEDIGGILYSNLQGKYIVDKYIMILTQ